MALVQQVGGMMDDFECDPGKSLSNLAKHGLPLDLAVLMFDGRVRAERLSIKSLINETRFESLAEIDGRVLFCVHTWNGNRRRAISLRPAHRSERRAYSQAIDRRPEASRGFRLV
jgi:uncharacterized protein